jgi:hypothetical protein
MVGKLVNQKDTTKKFSLDNLKPRVILSFLITFFGIAYLSLVLAGKVNNKDRLGQTEVIIFTTVLLLNSELIERLAKIQFGKDGMTVELEEVKKKQVEQQAEIESMVAFLVKRTMDETDYDLLQKMAGDYPIEFDRSKDSLRHIGLSCLCELGLIEKVEGKPLCKGDIELLPSPTANLKDYISISKRGRECLLLVKKYVVENLELK